MLDISRRLLYYKRKDVQEAIVAHCEEREVGIRYGGGFGKRPDVLVYANDVMESMKKGATSYHISEERWINPMHLQPGMRKAEMDDLRSGWDLVLDIDCPYWKLSKLTSHMFVRALRMHNIDSVSCKFSGNKGFHIGVPFEAFPAQVNKKDIKDWFPEGPKRIALYLLDYIANNLINVENGTIIFDGRYKTSIEKLSKTTGKPQSELTIARCPDCKRESKTGQVTTEFICPKCHKHVEEEGKMKVCDKCNVIMEKLTRGSNQCVCGSEKDPVQVFDPLSIVEVDTILISARHMFRAPYSMHEKSGLVSVPIDPDKVLEFEKTMAEPENVDTSMRFLDTDVSQDAVTLIVNALDYGRENILYQDIVEKETSRKKDYEPPKKAIPEKYFAPSIKKGLEGLEDGKKRFLFILLNFLYSVGWTDAMIEERVREWNEKNPEPLRENYIAGQLRYSKQKKKKVLPPNYDNGVYKDLGIPDDEKMMQRYKNPVLYTKILYKRRKKRRKQRLKNSKKSKKSNEAASKGHKG